MYPQNRRELYLAKMAGADVPLPEEPSSREEMYLAAMAAAGGGAKVVYLRNNGLSGTCWWPDSDEPVSASEARQLYTEWLAGKIRILVYTSNDLSMGGGQAVVEPIRMCMSANDSSGNTATIQAVGVHNNEIKSFYISNDPFDV